MVELLSRLFVRDHQNPQKPQVRRRYGTMVSVVGILLNALLACAKLFAGFLSGSVSVMADAVNNLADSGSSVIACISFRISGKPADRAHPFGHARIEYVASMIVAFLILLIGFEFLKESIAGILAPKAVAFDLVTVVILSLSLLGKLWLSYFNRKIGKRVDSSVMRAAATDALSDALSTLCVLATAIASLVVKQVTGGELPFPLDAYMGILVAGFILFSGARVLNETKNSILGEAPSEETVNAIRGVVLSYPEALGIHDLMVHSYGAGHTVASLHVEVDGKADIFASHEAVDAMEQRLYGELGVVATIHLDPIVVGDAIVDETKAQIADLVKTLYPGASIHDFRMVKGEKRSNLIFDLEIPFEEKASVEEITEKVQSIVHTFHPDYFAVIHVDRV